MTGILTLSLLGVLLAQERPKIAIHPLQIQAERHEADLRIRFTQEVLQRRVSSIGARQIPSWLAGWPKSSCMGEVDCLTQMAEAMGASYTLYASLAVGEQNYRMSGKVVRADGELVRQVEGLDYSRDLQRHWGDDVQEAFKVFLGQLQPETLPPRPLMLAAAEEAAVEGEAAAAEEMAVADEKVAGDEEVAADEGVDEPAMELDLQESGVEQAKPRLRRAVSQRRGVRLTRKAAEVAGGAEGAAEGLVLPRKVEPLVGWAPSNSTWAKPRYMELHNKPAPLRTTAYVMTGVSGSAFLAGGIFGLMAQSKKSFLEKNAPKGVVKAGVSPESILAAHKKAQLYPKVGVYLAGSGLVFAGAAATCFILSHMFEEGMPFVLAPMAGGASLNFQKSF